MSWKKQPNGSSTAEPVPTVHISLYDDNYYIPADGEETKPCIAQDYDPTTIVLCGDGQLYNASDVPGWITNDLVYDNPTLSPVVSVESSGSITYTNYPAIVVTAVGMFALVMMVAFCSSKARARPVDNSAPVHNNKNRNIPYGHHHNGAATAAMAHAVIDTSAPVATMAGGGDCGGGGFSGGGFSGGGDCGGGGGF